jgi:hypothetical protein
MNERHPVLSGGDRKHARLHAFRELDCKVPNAAASAEDNDVVLRL